jgi:small conductance mechanosensitive channel
MAFTGEVGVERFVLFLAVILATIITGNVLAAAVRKYLRLKNKKSWFFVLLPKIILYTIYAMGFYYATYRIIQFDVKAFAAAFGIIGLVIAFSSQQTLQNIIAGLIILLDRPIQEGDYVEVTGVLCKVVDISLRKTKLRAVDGRLIIAPNSQFVTGNVISYSKNPFFRLSLSIPVNPESDLEKAKALLYQMAVEHPDVIPKRPLKRKSLIETMLHIPPNIQKFEPKVWVKYVNKERVLLELWCWITEIRARERIISELLQGMRRKFAEEGVKFG